MKRLKKFMSILLTAIMVLAMCVPVMADGTSTTPTTPTSYTITAPNTNHQYEIYQIFTGDLSGSTLSNIKWGVNGTGTTGEIVDATVLNALDRVKNVATDKDKLSVIQQYVTLRNPVATITNGTSYTADPGYYLIKDKDGSVSGDDTYTRYLVKVVNDVNITPKSDKPSFEKKIKDTNDTTGDTSNWQDSADYDIGDAVPFQLKGTVAADYEDYKEYYFAFHDKEETGLTFNSTSVKVYVDGTEITSGYSLKTSAPTPNCEDADCTFEVEFSDLKQISAVHGGSVITVEYTSTLNENAVIGANGNVNKARLKYSNNPNQTQSGTPSKGETPWDNVIVFTYKVVVNKVNENNVALPGAEFTLSKKLKDGSTKDIAVVKNLEETKFTFSGLDDGNYVLTETKTPSGYNTISPITFTVTANHEITWNGEPRDTILTSLSGSKVTGEITFTADTPQGSLSADVVNNSGSTLPSTGGIGTTIFYVVGVILMLGAGVLLVTKKRMGSNR